MEAEQNDQVSARVLTSVITDVTLLRRSGDLADPNHSTQPSRLTNLTNLLINIDLIQLVPRVKMLEAKVF